MVPPVNNIISNTTNTNTYGNPCAGPFCPSNGNYITDSIATTTLYTSGTPTLQTVTHTAYATVSSVGKPSSVSTWDYSTPSSNPSILPTTTPTQEIDYTYGGPGIGGGINPYQVTVKDSSGNQAALTTYLYLYTGVPATFNLPNHMVGLNPSPTAYLHTVSQWVNTSPASPSTTTYTMDDSGTIIGILDPNGHSSTVSYQCSNSLPYQVAPLGNSLYETQYTYDCSSGAISSVQDPNDLANGRPGTMYTYEAQMGRPQTITRSDGGTTTYSYPSATEVDSVTTATPDPSIAGVTLVDSFGRPSSSISGGVRTDTNYDGNGRVSCVSDPYTTSALAYDCITSYDGLDRPLVETLQDSSIRSWSYNSNVTTSTDERSVSWARAYDALGRLTSVTEPGPSTSLLTSYSYDGLGNVTTITQSGNASAGESPRVRTFTYDSMARIVCASNPENLPNSGTTQAACPASAASANPAGTTSYTYDLAGNLRSKTDGKGTGVSVSYDQLNRPTLKQYSGSNSSQTQPAKYGYDGNSETGTPLSSYGLQSINAIGRLSIVTNGGNAATIYSYDAMGRVNNQNQVLPSVLAWGSIVSASYDLAGKMTSLTYPDGRTVQQSYDATSRLSSVNYQSWGATQVNQPYFTANSTNGYDPAGHLINGTFGNGVVVGASYDTRERVQTLAYGSASAPVWSKQFGWTPNSNLQTQTDLITGVQRQFGYDNLNRLTSAQDIFSNLAIPSGSNGETGSTSTSGSGAYETPGQTGAAPQWTNPDDSNALSDMNSGAPGWAFPGATTLPNSVIAPDGSMTAMSVTAPSSGDGFAVGYVASPSAFTGETMSGSVWLRCPSGTQNVLLYILQVAQNGFTAAAVSQVQVTTSWQQFQLSGATQQGLTALFFQIGGSGSVTNGQSFDMWNPMLEDQGVMGSSVTNLLPNSQRITASTWTATQVTITDNAASAPDGSNTGATMTAATNGSLYGLVPYPAPYSGMTVTGSVWLRVPDGSASQQVDLGMYQAGSSGFTAVAATTVTVTTSWQRFQLSGTTQTALTLLAFQIGGNNSTVNGETIVIWGAQMELASTAGPYVATAGTPMTQGTAFSNLLPYSQQLMAPSWNIWQASVAANADTAPDGGQTAAVVTASSNSTDTYASDPVTNASLYDQQVVTASVYLRSTTGLGSLNLYVVQSGGNNPFNIGINRQVTLNSTWQRFQLTGMTDNALTGLRLQIGGGGTVTAAQSFEVWGAQIELAPHAGPYIATSALPVISGGQLTNIFPNSQQLNGPSWFIYAGSTIPASSAAPDGSSTAAAFTAAAGSSDSYVSAIVPNPSLYDGETVTASVYLRANSGTQPLDLFLVEVGDQGWQLPNQSSLTLTTTWQRFALTGTLQNGLTEISLQIGGGGSVQNGQGFQVWGAQFVVGSDPAPYTPTPTTTTIYATGGGGTLIPNGLNESYNYDSFGNILQNGSFNSSYTANNQLFGYAYDGAGNLLSDGMNAFTWDAGESPLVGRRSKLYL